MLLRRGGVVLLSRRWSGGLVRGALAVAPALPHLPANSFSAAPLCVARCAFSSTEGGAGSAGTTASTEAMSSKGGACSPSMGKGNYFAFFGFPRQPELDGAVLQRRYHTLQRRVHPDQKNVQSKENEEAAQAEAKQSAAAAAATADATTTSQEAAVPVPPPEAASEVSAYANGAYETLRDPFLRCRYLSRLARAQLAKGDVPLTAEEEEALLVEDDKATVRVREESGDIPMTESFLMEVLAMNELIFGGDREDQLVRNQMKVLQADLEEREDVYFDQAKRHWADGNLQGFHQNVLEWTYINNALRHLKNRL